MTKYFETVLGYYKPGDLPVVLDTTTTSLLTSAHESVHSNDLSCTIFGHLFASIIRAEEHGAHTFIMRRRLKRQISQLYDMSWHVLEGNAILHEVLILIAQGRDDQLSQYKSTLPDNYKAAVEVFNAIESIQLRFFEHSHRQLELCSALTTAITEFSLDVPCLSHITDSKTYTAIQNLFDHLPSKIARSAIDAISDISAEHVTAFAEDPSNERYLLPKGGTADVRRGRLEVLAIKLCIAESLYPGIEAEQLSDVNLMREAERIRNIIEAEFSLTPVGFYHVYRESPRYQVLTDGKPGKNSFSEQGIQLDSKVLDPDGFLGFLTPENLTALLNNLSTAANHNQDKINIRHCHILMLLYHVGSTSVILTLTAMGVTDLVTPQGDRHVATLPVYRHCMMPLARIKEVIALAEKFGVILVSGARLDGSGSTFSIIEEPYLASYRAPLYMWSRFVSDELMIRLLDTYSEAEVRFTRFSRDWCYGVVIIKTYLGRYVFFEQSATQEKLDANIPLVLNSAYSIEPVLEYNPLDHIVCVFIEAVGGELQFLLEQWESRR